MPTPPAAARILAAGAVALAVSVHVGGCEFAQATLADEGPVSSGALTFSIEPEYAMAGQPIGPGIAVTVLDGQGDTVVSSAATIRLSIWSGTGNATAQLTGTTQVAAVSGTASFPGVSIDSAGTGYRLRAVSDGLRSAVSDSFDVTAVAGASAGRSPKGGRGAATFRHPPS
jgi:hypothetical protein